MGALLGIAGFQLILGLREPEHPLPARAEQVAEERAPRTPTAAIPESPKKSKPPAHRDARDGGLSRLGRLNVNDGGRPAPELSDAGSAKAAPP